jgi:hypothetical protein
MIQSGTRMAPRVRNEKRDGFFFTGIWFFAADMSPYAQHAVQSTINRITPVSMFFPQEMDGIIAGDTAKHSLVSVRSGFFAICAFQCCLRESNKDIFLWDPCRVSYKVIFLR